MKKAILIIKSMLVLITGLAWIIFICGADSLLEERILIPALIIILFMTYMCKICISFKDLARMSFMSPKEYRRSITEEI